jgi:hypothetical protein
MMLGPNVVDEPLHTLRFLPFGIATLMYRENRGHS